MTTSAKTGACGKCGRRVVYRSIGSTMSIWVHEDDGNFMGRDPEPHDCNTSVQRDPEET